MGLYSISTRTRRCFSRIPRINHPPTRLQHCMGSELAHEIRLSRQPLPAISHNRPTSQKNLKRISKESQKNLKESVQPLKESRMDRSTTRYNSDLGFHGRIPEDGIKHPKDISRIFTGKVDAITQTDRHMPATIEPINSITNLPRTVNCSLRWPIKSIKSAEIIKRGQLLLSIWAPASQSGKKNNKTKTKQKKTTASVESIESNQFNCIERVVKVALWRLI